MKQQERGLILVLILSVVACCIAQYRYGPTEAPRNANAGNSGPSAGLIVGIMLGIIAVVAIVGVLAFTAHWYMQKKRAPGPASLRGRRYPKGQYSGWRKVTYGPRRAVPSVSTEYETKSGRKSPSSDRMAPREGPAIVQGQNWRSLSRPESSGKSESGSEGKPEGGIKGRSESGIKGKPVGGIKGKSEASVKEKASSDFMAQPQGGIKGRPEGGIKGKPEGGIKGKPEASVKEIAMSDMKAQPQGAVKGKLEGGIKGKPEGGIKGKPDGGIKGKPEGVFKGKRQGGINRGLEKSVPRRPKSGIKKRAKVGSKQRSKSSTKGKLESGIKGKLNRLSESFPLKGILRGTRRRVTTKTSRGSSRSQPISPAKSSKERQRRGRQKVVTPSAEALALKRSGVLEALSKIKPKSDSPRSISDVSRLAETPGLWDQAAGAVKLSTSEKDDPNAATGSQPKVFVPALGSQSELSKSSDSGIRKTLRTSTASLSKKTEMTSTTIGTLGRDVGVQAKRNGSMVSGIDPTQREDVSITATGLKLSDIRQPISAALDQRTGSEISGAAAKSTASDARSGGSERETKFIRVIRDYMDQPAGALKRIPDAPLHRAVGSNKGSPAGSLPSISSPPCVVQPGFMSDKVRLRPAVHKFETADYRVEQKLYLKPCVQRSQEPLGPTSPAAGRIIETRMKNRTVSTGGVDTVKMGAAQLSRPVSRLPEISCAGSGIASQYADPGLRAGNQM